jgi:hypothetical protein
MLALMQQTNGFSVRSHVGPGRRAPKSHRYVVDPSIIESSSSMMIADDSWRQYVFPVVTFGVLGDILLGSPLANAVLKPMKPTETDDEAEEQASTKIDVSRSKERIDSDKYAKDAIARAQNTLELRRFLDERKTDWDKMEDMKKALDEGMQDFDSGYQTREEAYAEELKKRKK